MAHCHNDTWLCRKDSITPFSFKHELGVAKTPLQKFGNFLEHNAKNITQKFLTVTEKSKSY